MDLALNNLQMLICHKTQPTNTPNVFLQRAKPPTNEYPVDDSKQYDSEAPVMMELWVMWSTPSLPSFPGLLWPKVVTFDKVLSMGQIELFDISTECKQITYTKSNCFK